MASPYPVAELAACAAVSAAVTVALTLFDMESTFGAAALSPRHVRRTAWWWAFLLANGALSVGLWILFRNYSSFRSWNPWLYSLAIGLGYPALVRLKLATISLREQSIPLGLDAFYEGAREYVYVRINMAVKAERAARAQQLIVSNDLKTLAKKVRFDIEFDSLTPKAEKVRRLEWLLQVLKDDTVDDGDKKEILAIALTNGTPIPL